MTNIPLWSKSQIGIEEVLKLVQTTEWSELTQDDKKLIWHYLEYYLFSPKRDGSPRFEKVDCAYEFFGEDMGENDRRASMIGDSAIALNHKYKKQSYARRILENSTYNAACEDFYSLFISGSRDIVFELLTFYSNFMVIAEEDTVYKKQDEDNPAFELRKEIVKWKLFDAFATRLSEVFEEFGINFKLSRLGFISADEPKVAKEIYMPALAKLSHRKWNSVNRDLRDAFEALTKDKDGSGALTHALAALQGLLQTMVHGNTGKGDTAALINDAIKKKIIPDDDFSKKIIKEMNSFWAKERQEKGDPHPKKLYATKQQAKLVIGQVMLFVDYVL